MTCHRNQHTQTIQSFIKMSSSSATSYSNENTSQNPILVDDEDSSRELERPTSPSPLRSVSMNELPPFDAEAEPQSTANPIAAVEPDETQKQLDTLMGVMEDNQATMPEGDYLRGMNALGGLHKITQTKSFQAGTGSWFSHEQVHEYDELYETVMDLADDILNELNTTSDVTGLMDDDRIVPRGEELELFTKIMNYTPIEGTVGFGVAQHVLHHALQFITFRIFTDTYDELEIVRPVSCKCGWRGAQGNWDKHFRNVRHQRWAAVNNVHDDDDDDSSSCCCSCGDDSDSDSVSVNGVDENATQITITANTANENE